MAYDVPDKALYSAVQAQVSAADAQKAANDAREAQRRAQAEMLGALAVRNAGTSQQR
jgi:hypothetical protein